MGEPAGARPGDVVLAVDLGGSAMKGAVVSVAGAPVSLQTRTTAERPEDNLDLLLALLTDLAGEARRADLRPAGVGVVTPGVVDRESGTVGYASNLGWRDVPLRQEIQARLGLPVQVGHDARAAGMAEALVGHGRDVEQFVHVPIGTGIAAAIVCSGSALIGATHAAGELGHIPVHPQGEWCVCGQRGCLEVYASGAGIVRRYEQRSGNVVSGAADVVTRRRTDLAASEIWTDAVEALALGLATTTLLLDPELVVIGGGLARAGEALLGPLRVALSDRLSWRPAPVLELSALGSEAGRIGASMLGMVAAQCAEVMQGWTRESAMSLQRAELAVGG